MGHKLIVARWQNKIISALYDGKRPLQIIADSDEEKQGIRMGGIYLGKVKNIVKNINAAFVEIQEGTVCYLSLDVKGKPVTLQQHADGLIHAGDELAVQVEREEIKTKLPSVTVNFSLTGKYAVLVHGKPIVGISSKIENQRRRRELKDFFENHAGEEYGFIVRTNAETATEQELYDELSILKERYQRIVLHGKHLTRFSVLEQPLPAYLCSIRDDYSSMLEEILTDDPVIFEQMQEYLKQYQPEDAAKLFFYEKDLPLIKLFSLESRLKEALSRKVWLKSGASLIIEPTEALTVIDVNTGKAVNGRKRGEEYFLDINLEAAREIACQIRLRNLSGIIIIDFIDLALEESRQILLSSLGELLKADPVKTTLVDMTPLHLVEITRKKVRKPLHEQFLPEQQVFLTE